MKVKRGESIAVDKVDTDGAIYYVEGEKSSTEKGC